LKEKPARRGPIALAIAAAWVLPAAHADEPFVVARKLPPVVVRGTNDSFAPAAISTPRLGADPMDVPQSVIVVNQELMQSQGATTLASALRNVPGLTIGAAEGGQIGTNINLNGFSARTDVYLDGMRDRGQYYRDTFALDAVEVLMGPSSMLFGRGSTGGVINQVTKKPKLAPLAEASAGVTTNGLARSTLDFGRPLSEDSAWRVAAMVQGGSASDREQSKQQDFGIAPSIAFGIGTPTQVTVTALLQHNRDQPDYGLPPLNGAPANVDRRTAYGFTSDRTVSDVGSLGVTVQHRLGAETTLRNQLQYNDVRTHAIETAAQGIGTIAANGAYVPLATGSSAAPLPASSTLPLDQLWVRQQSHDRDIHDRSLFNVTEIRTQLQTGGITHQVLGGFEIGADRYANQTFFRNGTCNGIPLNPPGGTSGYVACTPLVDPPQVASPPGVVPIAGNRQSGSATSAALFVNDSMSLGEHWKIVAGVRRDRFRASIANSNPTATSLAATSQTVGFTSVRAGAIWQPGSDRAFYASYSTSFNPSLEQLVATTGATQPLPPQRNRAYEAGMKWDLHNGELSTTAAVFRITQYNARAQNSDGTYSATGTVQVDGFRAGASGRLTSRTNVFLAYTHLDAQIVDGIAPATQGRTPANTPRDSASLWATWRVTPEWEVGGGGTFVSYRYANNTDLTRVPGSARFDAVIAWHQPKFDVRLNLFNLGDKRYYDALIPSDGGRAVPGIGRSAMLSVDYRF
jgi:catecholate siderophore receptor